MKLVITYVVSDECTYSYSVVQPLEYESAEAFAVGFEEACKQGRLEWEHSRPRPENFSFAGIEWQWDDFISRGSDKQYKYYGPTVQTLEEWFEQNKGIRQ